MTHHITIHTKCDPLQYDQNKLLYQSYSELHNFAQLSLIDGKIDVPLWSANSMLSDGVIFDKMLHVNMWLRWKGNKYACKYALINLFHPKPPVAINTAGRSQEKKSTSVRPDQPVFNHTG